VIDATSTPPNDIFKVLFIDRNVIAPNRVKEVARETGAIPYDIPGVELSHVGELCSFDAFLKKYELDTPALQHVALIVRGADTSRLDLAPEAPGLFAISQGLAQNFSDDHEMLRHGMVIYDALYTWCAKPSARLQGVRKDA
jgi:hypothetical protein